MIYNNCPNCFMETATEVCPHCNYDQKNLYNNAEKSILFPEEILNGRYLLGRMLGRGGFGITYIAKDLVENKIVAIKEYMPENYAQREGSSRVVPNSDSDETIYRFEKLKKTFREEYESLKRLNHFNFVVSSLDYFSDNNTEYLVMEYVDGVTLKTLTSSNAERLSVREALYILISVGSILMEIHKLGIIHRDISPENIMITTEKEVKLIDFGASTNYIELASKGDETIFMKPGYSPMEQRSLTGKQGPWTDVYALGATFYDCVTTNPLIDAEERSKTDYQKPLKYLYCGVEDLVSNAVEKAMCVDCRERYQSVSEFLDAIWPIFRSTKVEIESKTISLIKARKQIAVEANLNPYVFVESGENQGKCIPLSDDYVVVGRDPQAVDLLINDSDEVSGIHCMIAFNKDSNQFVVTDKSTNGTYRSNSIKLPKNREFIAMPGEMLYLSDRSVKISLRLM